MNIFDIIALVVFFSTVIICTFKGLLKIVAHFGAFFAAMIVSKLLGGMLGEKLLGGFLGKAAPTVGIIVLFILLLIVFRIIFKLLAKLITKAFNAKGLDRFLGMLFGILGGFAGVCLLGFVAELIIVVASLINDEASIITVIESATILRYFMN